MVMRQQGTRVEFKWTGVDRSGLLTRGNLFAPNKLLARVALHQQGITPRRVRRAHWPWFRSKKRLTPEEIVEFIRQLAGLLAAHIPLTRALETLKNAQQHATWYDSLSTIQHDLEAGNSLADAFRRQPFYFKPLLCNLVAIGEQSATLSWLLAQLATDQARWFTLQRQIKQNLAYPVTLVCLTVVVSAGLLLYVVPQFEQFFQHFSAPLPSLTQWMLSATKVLQQYALVALGLSFITSLLFHYFYRHTLIVALAVDQFLLNLPRIGLIIQCAIMARLTATLSTTLHAGLPLTDALLSCTGVVGNRLIAQALTSARAKVVQGISLSNALKQSPLFPHRLVQLVMIGEESGNLQTMLNQLREHYYHELEHAMRQLTQWLEPLLMVVLGCLIGLVIIAMYLPIVQLGAIV